MRDCGRGFKFFEKGYIRGRKTYNWNSLYRSYSNEHTAVSDFLLLI